MSLRSSIMGRLNHFGWETPETRLGRLWMHLGWNFTVRLCRLLRHPRRDDWAEGGGHGLTTYEWRVCPDCGRYDERNTRWVEWASSESGAPDAGEPGVQRG